MKEQQARLLADEINRRYADIIQATVDDSDIREEGRGWRVQLLFLPGMPDQRSASINCLVEWEGLLDAWSVLSADLEKLHVAKPRAAARRTACYYLVDGIAMTFHRRKSSGYWFGYSYRNGKTYTKYLGKADPHAMYPPCEAQAREK
jgi:hypothetical protein